MFLITAQGSNYSFISCFECGTSAYDFISGETQNVRTPSQILQTHFRDI